MRSIKILRMPWASIVLVGLAPHVCFAANFETFNPDTDPSRIEWSRVATVLGPVPDVRGQRFGVVLKTQTNEYWRLMGAGYRKRAAADGVKLDIQAAQSEDDPIRQLAIMENMIGGRYKALLLSPQSASNLRPAIDDAIAARLPMVDVDGAVVDTVTHFVGPMNWDIGERVARWFIQRYPAGGKVAVIEGQAGMFSTVRRSNGFRETLLATKKFEIVASVPGNWDKTQSYAAAVSILREFPDTIGIYCNNDTMALGVVEAVKSLDLLKQVRIFGSDGTRGAYTSIRIGELTGTVDIFPMLIGQIGLEVAERVSEGQTVPRVVGTPQALVTRETIDRYSGDDDSVQKALIEDAQTHSPP